MKKRLPAVGLLANKTLLSLTLFVLVIGVAEASGGQLPERIDLAKISVIVDDIKRDNPTIERKLERELKTDAVIFIPGILGSRLKDPNSGKTIWGDTAVSLNDLALTPNSTPAQPEILEKYFQDVYGDMQTELAGVLGADRPFLSFPYDWRQDIDWIAAQLEDQFRNTWREKLRNRRVTIIAHSMGGLVGWVWKNRFYKDGKYNFDLWRMILLGSPLEGSCEMLRMLLTGYRPIPGSHYHETLGYQVLFGELRAAAYTFPSVFQLLPMTGEREPDIRTSCLVVNMPQSGLTAVDHFAFPIWQRALLPLLEGSRYLFFFSTPSVWEKLNMSQDVFLKRLEGILRRSKEFRKLLNLFESPLQATGTREGRVRYFFSDRHKTTSQVYVDGNSVDSTRGVVPTGGDGRVLHMSATNGDRFSVTPTPLQSTHGDLVKDPNFLSWLRKDFYRGTRNEEVKDTIALLMNDEQGKRALKNHNVVLSLSEIDINPLRSDPDGRIQSILDMNAAVLQDLVRAMKPELLPEEISLQAYQFATYLHKEQQQAKLAIPFYEIAIARGRLPRTQKTRALVSYTEALLQDEDYGQAYTILTTSAALTQLIADNQLRPDVLNNLGVAYEGVGKTKFAFGAYGLAVKSGSDMARGNLKRLVAE